MRTLLLVAAALSLSAATLPVAASEHALLPIQPGGPMGDEDRQFCTLNFVFDGTGALAGRVFIGTAGHCVDSVGQKVASDDRVFFGRVVYMWGPGDLDFALIEVDPAWHARVSPEVRGHAGLPVGHTTESETSTGDRVMFSGWGMGYDLTQPTREGRQGLLVNDDAREYGVEGPILWGDSGGPVLHQSGKALGVVSRLGGGSCTGCEATWLVGPTIEGILAELAPQGWTIQLRTAA